MKQSVFLIIVIIALLSACVSNKKTVYLQNKTQALADTNRDYVRIKYKVQINDILSINVHTIDERAAALFNTAFGGQQIAQGGGTGTGDIFYLNGYTVSDSGQIELPMIGKVKVAGLTLNETKRVIEDAAKQYFNNFFVSVKFGGIRFSVLGEVNNPGKFVILQEQLNIFEALANAGDLTTVANRREVEIVRQFPEGPKVYSIDLTDRNVLYSPYYFVQPNDVVYIKPLRVKALGTGVTGFGTFQSVITVLSALVLIISLRNL